MRMKPNQRIALTKELIHRALISLLKKQDIHKISIRELCDIAGINRTTFYNHYGSQYDVLAEIRDWYIKDIASFALYGSYRLLQNWIAEDDRRSAEEMAHIIITLTSAVCSTGTKQ